MKTLKDRKILLVGGAGFIGHNLALSLKSQGANVSIIDSLEVNNILAFSDPSADIPNRKYYLKILNERLDLLKEAGIPFFMIDARNYSKLVPFIDDLKPQVIVHLAAIAHAARANKDPYSTFDHNLRTLENALDCARHFAEHFIYFSSSMVYGHFKEKAVTEESVCNPLGIYGTLKYAGEKIVESYNQVFDLPYTIIRPSALYGQRCVSRRVVQKFIESALSGEEITIHGDGSDSLDFTYIDDLVAGVEAVIQNEKSINETFNLTFGQSRSLSELVSFCSVRNASIKCFANQMFFFSWSQTFARPQPNKIFEF